MLAGVGTAALLNFSEMLFGVEGGIPFLWVAWWSFVVAISGVVIVSFMTKPYDVDRLRGLVCWIPTRANDSAPPESAT